MVLPGPLPPWEPMLILLFRFWEFISNITALIFSDLLKYNPVWFGDGLSNCLESAGQSEVDGLLSSSGSNLTAPSLSDLRPLLSCGPQSMWALSSGFSKTLLRKSLFTVKPWCPFKARSLWVSWASGTPRVYQTHTMSGSPWHTTKY